MNPRFSFRWKVFGLALLLAAYAAGNAGADPPTNIILRTFYPVPYGEYGNLTVRTKFTVGDQAPITTGSPATSDIVSGSTIYGNMTLNGTLTTVNALITLNPTMGPYGEDAFRVSTGLVTGSTRRVSVGADEGENRTDSNNTEPRLRVGTARFKVNTVIAGQTLYALDYVNSAGPNSVIAPGELTPTPHHIVGIMRGFTDTTRARSDEYKKAQFAAKYHQTSVADLKTNNYLFAPLYIDGYYVRLGEKMADRAYLGGALNSLGYMHTVLIRCQKAWYKTEAADWDDSAQKLLLQVGRPGQAAAEGNGDFQVFSSREFKQDIAPFTSAEYSGALDRVSRIPLYYYRMKDDPETNRLEFGVIAEDTSKEMLTPEGKGVNLMNAYGELMAAAKGLKIKNDALKKRLEYLEKQAAAR